jgi:hypothetical protein
VAAGVLKDVWYFITVTTATPFAGSAVILGLEASAYDGQMGLVRIYTDALTASEVAAMYYNERHLFGV